MFLCICSRLCILTQRTGGRLRPKLLPNIVVLVSKLPALPQPSPSGRQIEVLSSWKTSPWARYVCLIKRCLILHYKVMEQLLLVNTMCGLCSSVVWKICEIVFFICRYLPTREMMASVCLRVMPLPITVRAIFTNNYLKFNGLFQSLNLFLTQSKFLHFPHLSILVLTVLLWCSPVIGQGCVN